VVIVDTRHPEAVATAAPLDLVLDACAVWELDCEDTLDQAGAVVITLTDNRGRVVGAPESSHGIGGQATDDLCSPRVWARDDAITIAHELGHVLGLEHVGREGSDARNVMTPRVSADSDETTERQRRRVHRRARALALCPGHRPIIH
jgi:hypothetical protein